MLDDQSQAATAQFMGCEGARLFAAAAKLSITLTIGALPTYGFVVFLDFVYSCGTGQFDTDG